MGHDYNNLTNPYPLQLGTRYRFRKNKFSPCSFFANFMDVAGFLLGHDACFFMSVVNFF